MTFRHPRWIAALLLLALGGALAPGIARADRFAAVHRGTDAGLVQSQVRALLQDHRGFLWIGTHAGGLDRFDGVSFEHHTVRQGLPSNLVLDIEEHEGVIYAGTRQGLARLTDWGFAPVPLPEGYDDSQVNALEVDDGGRLWVGTYSGLFRLEGGSLTFVAQLGTVVRALQSDGKGGMWAASDLGLHHADEGGEFALIPGSEGLDRLGRIVRDAAGDLWLGTTAGLYRYEGGRIREIPLEDHPPGSRIFALYQDRDDSTWVSTLEGVVHLTPGGHQELWGTAEGLPDARVSAFLRDREGTLHIGTNGSGLVSLPRVPFYTWTRGPLQRYAPTRPVWIDDPARPTLWIPTLGEGLWRLRGETLTPVGADRGVPDADVVFVHQSDARLWVGMARGLVTSNDHERFHPPKGLPHALEDATFLDALTDRTGRLWFATGQGLVVFDGRGWEILGPEQGFPANEPLILRAAGPGRVWIGTQAAGAILWDMDARAVVTHLRGGAELPSDTVTAIVQHPDGRWWLGTDRGITVWDGREAHPIGWDQGLPEGYLYFLCVDPVAEEVWVGTSRGVGRWDGERFQVFGRGHGLPADEANTGACGVDPQGRLWLGTVEGYAIFDRTAQADIPPLDTILLDATVRDRPLPVKGLVELPYDDNDVRWRYLSPTFVDPAGVTYQTRLVGYRDDWVTTDQRVSQYAALPPGQFTFEVRGCIAGRCDPTPATSAVLIIHPPWYTRPWARALLSLLIFSGGASVALIRSRRLARRAEELERLVEERTAELADEKEKSDALLLNILPQEVVDELKADGVARPRQFEDVTILFTDLQGFTKAASTTTPEALVLELNEIFAAFDAISRAHGLEKLKTIGDAYMAVGGLPAPNTTHPVDAVTAGLRMQALMEARAARPGGFQFRLRVGVHTGQVVAGVIGTWKYAYDVWGDAVNIASRMESGGEPGRVNVSRATYERVKHAFRCEARGERSVKGKGAMEMFFVEAALPKV